MKNSKVLGFIAILIILSVGAGLLVADFSTEYLGTAYPRLLVLRDDATLTGLNATTPEGVYDGEYTAAPFSLSQEEILINDGLQLQFRDGNMFIHSDAATTLLIDGNTDLKLTGTAITMSGVVSTGNFISTGGGTSAINEIPIGGTTPAAGSFTTLGATGILDVAGATTLASLTTKGAVVIDGGSFIFNEDGADYDARFEGDTSVNLLFLDAGLDRIGMNTATPSATLDIVGTLEVSSTSAFTGAITATGGVVGDITGNIAGNVTSSGTSAFTTTTVSGTSTLSGFLIMASDIQVNSGNRLSFDADNDSGIESNTDDILDILIGASKTYSIDASTISPEANGAVSLGVVTTHEWKDIFTQDIHISDDADVTGTLNVGILSAGATAITGAIDATAAAVFNADGGDNDFTVRSDDNSIAFVVDASEDNIELGAAISYNTPQVFADVDASPSVAGYSFFLSGGAAETITTFDSPNPQQYIIILSKAAITFDFDDDDLACGTADLVTASGDITHWMYYNNVWYLQTFIDQSQDLNTW